MSFKITYYKPVRDEKSNIKAYFGVYIAPLDLYLSRIRYMKRKSGGFFASPPSEKFTTADGEVRYSNYFFFGKKMNERFQEQCEKAIDEYIRNNQDKLSKYAEQSDSNSSEQGLPF